MKILALSGSHENTQVVRAFADRLAHLDCVPDVFVSAGDLGPRCMVDIFESLVHYGKPILYVLGNHCLHYPSGMVGASKARVNALPGTFALESEDVMLGAWTFIGQDAWTDFTDDEWDPQRYYRLKERTRGRTRDSTILVTHHAPLGVFDAGSAYPLHSYRDAHGMLHAGSLGLRAFVDEFRPRIHIYAHCHSDGCRHKEIGGTLFVNVCHLERMTRSGAYGVTGSFEIIDTDGFGVMTYHLSVGARRRCMQCGSENFIAYAKCVNCIKAGKGLIPSHELP